MTVAALPVALEYTAPAECPARDAFWQSVARVTPKLRRAVGDEAARGYRVSIDVAGDAFLGELRQTDKPEPRTLEASDCAELAEALALMLVLSTEQEASDATPPPSPVSTTLHASDSDTTDELTPTLGRGARPTALFIGGLGWLGAAPDPLLGVSAGLEHTLGSVVVARVEIRVAFANTRADTTYMGLAPQVCARWYLRTPELSACAGASVGTLQVKGVEYRGP